ncbi:pre-mRNA-splicing factor ATP-dependent RNA helicase PRP16, putative [Entamoeba invadens IP1]|uniref:RNA helicase n=1 Tax=Entamoeba invadens IP1 TaxID=370355 RepID=A0A0A1UDW1_ENTIV|nr:pre-mRNA-splicing factor ATP-dependent RNA helicase PRP16, putative [Entamoeba invadens IP1]ELP94791.1 pre-mRNA-splicing factor ATP-dependent RNA helicase PRP16, putative [Entamoeba invadens IP1]|eukprot:XP_004261562.1 pre-mRNA-splicing factor ATP-dependent RNA helicase PRP16, putative [Entamoeba invadens IP1]
MKRYEYEDKGKKRLPETLTETIGGVWGDTKIVRVSRTTEKSDDSDPLLEFYDDEINDQQKQEVELALMLNPKNKDAGDSWAEGQMVAGGVKRAEKSGVIEEEEEVQILVKKIIPQFMEGMQGRLQQASVVVPLKDATSDIAKLSKTGSETLIKFRERKEKEKGSKKVLESDTALSKLHETHGNTTSIQTDKSLKSDSKTHQKDEEDPFVVRAKIKKVREELPIHKKRMDIINTIRENQAVIIVGETGSGKTTQIVQYLYESGFGKKGIIGCTQPRRVAAVSVCERVSVEMSSTVGSLVGYTIRFEDKTSPKTRVKFMTDGILLREIVTDPFLDKYSVIIMDEAHERSLNTDILFGVLKRVLRERSDIRLVITSATIDENKLSNFFGRIPVLHIEGRTFPVKVNYMRSSPSDYIETATREIISIHTHQGPGDILVFMTGQEDIEITCEIVREKLRDLGKKVEKPLEVIPIYSQLSSEAQKKIFEESENRKVIVATNIAETSLTVNGVRFVIDSGLGKWKVYNPKIGMDSLQVFPESKQNAEQRKGRAGRTQSGVCYRMFTESTYNRDLLDAPIPEIQRTNLSNTILLLKAIGIEKVIDFEMLDPPSEESVMNSMYELWVLGALNESGALTQLGKKMSEFPLEPALGKLLITSEEYNCSEEALTIAAMLTVPNVFVRPKEREEEADAAREKFYQPDSDHITLVHVYNQWKKHEGDKRWCESNFVNMKGMNKAKDVRTQLADMLRKCGGKEVSCGRELEKLRKCITACYFYNAAKIKGQSYANLRTGVNCVLHPTSALFNMGVKPNYVIYHELLLTSNSYMRCVTAIEGKWLAELGEVFFQQINLKKSTK